MDDNPNPKTGLRTKPKSNQHGSTQRKAKHRNIDAAFLTFAADLSNIGLIDLAGVFSSSNKRQTPKHPNDPSALLNVADAAAALGLSPKTLANWRVSGAGPRFSKIGGRVAYMNSDLQAFVAANLKVSTSDKGGAEHA